MAKYSQGQTWGALRKAWKGYNIARSNQNKDKQRYYASLIQQLEHDLGKNITYNFRGLSQNFKGNLLDCDFKGSKSNTRKSPKAKRRSTKRKSRSPKRKSRSPKRKSRSPKRKSRSPKRKSRSPKRKSRSTKRRSSKRKSSTRRYAKFSPRASPKLRGRK